MLKSEDHHNHLAELEDSVNPAWLFDTQNEVVKWANLPGLAVFGAQSLDALPEESVNSEVNLKKIAYLRDLVPPSETKRDSLALETTEGIRVVLADYQFVTLDDDTPAVLIQIPSHESRVTLANPPMPPESSEASSTANEREQVQERYRALFELASEAIAISDADDRTFLDVNPRFEELFGVDLNELNYGTRNFYDLSPAFQPDGRDSIQLAGAYTRRALAGESISFEWTFLDSHGKPLPTVMRLSRFPDPKRRLLRTSITDVSEIRQAEQERKRLEDQLAQSQKLESLGQLTGGIAHDFNNILAVILGNMEILADDISDPNQSELIQTAIAATERGARLTRSMLAFARKSDLQPETFNLGQIVSGLDDWITSSLPDNIAVSTRCASDLKLVQADYTGAERTLLNLVINARDAMPNGGSLRISVENLTIASTDEASNVPPGEYVRLAVSDTGIGIPEELMNHVYDPFFSTKEGMENSGLGLSMVHGFMKQSGGEVQIDSVVGQGTTFELVFPAVVEAAGGDATSDTNQGLTLAARLRILLVEDQEPLLAVLKRILEKEGHQVTTALSGDEAAILHSERIEDFDLLISDIDMPGKLQGPDLVQKMKALHDRLAVILLSGYSTATSGDELRLQKPISRKQLIEAIDELMQSHRKQ